MKECTIRLEISKGHTVIKEHVTPLEVMLLASSFQFIVNGNPIEVIKDTERDVPTKIVTPIKRDLIRKVKVGTYTDLNGKSVDHYEEKNIPEWKDVETWIPERTDNDEFARLKQFYGKAKVEALRTKFVTMPGSFEEAIQLGLGISLPQKRLLQPSPEEVKKAVEAVTTK